MPQPFKNAVMTRAGALLLTRAQAGEIKIEFTGIAIGNGTYTEEEKTFSVLQEMTGLKSMKNSYGLSGVEIYSEHSVKVTALITNQDAATGAQLVSEGYFINEMGLFAKEKDGGDDTEVLYSIAVTESENGDFMPPYNGFCAAQIIQEYYATVSNSAEVTIQTSGAFALAGDLDKFKRQTEETIKKIEEQLQWVISALCSYSYDSASRMITGLLPHGYADGILEFPEEAAHADGSMIVLDRAAGGGIPSVPGSAGIPYVLPAATADTLGGVKIGPGIRRMSDGTISVDTDGVAESVSGRVAVSAAEKAAEIVEANATEPSDEDIDGLFAGT